MEMKKFVNLWIEKTKGQNWESIREEMFDLYMTNVVNTDRDKLFSKYLMLKIKKSKTFQYLITFTIDPKKHNVKDETLHRKIENYIKLRFTREAIGAIRADIVKEGSTKENIHTHWHVALKSSKWLLKKSFKYYEKLYGFVQINKSTNNNYENRLNYLNKSNTSTKFI